MRVLRSIVDGHLTPDMLFIIARQAHADGGGAIAFVEDCLTVCNYESDAVVMPGNTRAPLLTGRPESDNTYHTTQ
jgi:hypothetical protein